MSFSGGQVASRKSREKKSPDFLGLSYTDSTSAKVGLEAIKETPRDLPSQSQNPVLPSLKDKEFVPIDTQYMTISSKDVQHLESIGYQFGQKLGTGSYGEVYRCLFNDGSNKNIELAAKLVLMKDSMNRNELIEALNFIRRQSVSLSRAYHPHVVALRNVISSIQWNRCPSSPTYSYYGYSVLFMELADNSFENYIRVRGIVPEEEAIEFLAQIVIATGYLHSIGVAHRNIKPVNILLFRNENFRAGYLLKLCDFGTTHMFDVREEPVPESSEPVATMLYRAPETDEHDWSNKDHSYDPRLADVYSIGVVLVQMLAGYQNTMKTRLTSSKRHHGKKFITLMTKLGMSHDSIDLVNNMVRYKAEERYTIAQVLRHRFFPPSVVPEGCMSSAEYQLAMK